MKHAPTTFTSAVFQQASPTWLFGDPTICATHVYEDDCAVPRSSKPRGRKTQTGACAETSARWHAFADFYPGQAPPLCSYDDGPCLSIRPKETQEDAREELYRCIAGEAPWVEHSRAVSSVQTKVQEQVTTATDSVDTLLWWIALWEKLDFRGDGEFRGHQPVDAAICEIVRIVGEQRQVLAEGRNLIASLRDDHRAAGVRATLTWKRLLEQVPALAATNTLLGYSLNLYGYTTKSTCDPTTGEINTEGPDLTEPRDIWERRALKWSGNKACVRTVLTRRAHLAKLSPNIQAIEIANF